jgi:hypothetical protein
LETWPKFRKYLKGIRDESLVMIDNFISVASTVLEHGGDVSFEWPAFCEGWTIDRLQSFSASTAFKPQDVMGVPLD